MNKLIHCILDTDADNEIDDQFAISYLFKSNRVIIEGISAAPYLNDKVNTPEEGMNKSYNEIKKVLKLCNKEITFPVLLGSEYFLKNVSEPVKSEAAYFIVNEAQKYTKEDPLYVLAIGSLTNVASALLINPEIKDKIHVVFLGGIGKEFLGVCTEFNLSEDVLASQIVYKNVEKLTVLPCPGVVSELKTTKPELEYWLKNKNELCDYLIQNTIDTAEKYAKDKPWSRVIWDISAVAYLFNKNDNFMSSRKEKRFYHIDSKNIESFDGPSIEYVYRIDRDHIFEDLFDVIRK